MSRRVRSLLLLGTLGIALAAPLAPAQNRPDDNLPPKPTIADDPPILRTYILLALLTAGVVGVNMIKSKRGHQD